MSKKLIECPEAGKLALRREGFNWTAYHQMPDGNRTFMMQIDIEMMEETGMHEEFKQFAWTMLQKHLQNLTGYKFDSNGSKPAPENERSGRA